MMFLTMATVIGTLICREAVRIDHHQNDVLQEHFDFITMQQEQQLVSAGGGGGGGGGAVMPAPSVQPLQYGGYAGPRSGTVVPTYLSRQSMGLGVTLVVCGALAIIFNGVAIGVHDSLSYVGHGIWIGIMV